MIAYLYKLSSRSPWSGTSNCKWNTTFFYIKLQRYISACCVMPFCCLWYFIQLYPFRDTVNVMNPTCHSRCLNCIFRVTLSSCIFFDVASFFLCTLIIWYYYYICLDTVLPVFLNPCSLFVHIFQLVWVDNQSPSFSLIYYIKFIDLYLNLEYVQLVCYLISKLNFTFFWWL